MALYWLLGIGKNVWVTWYRLKKKFQILLRLVVLDLNRYQTGKRITITIKITQRLNKIYWEKHWIWLQGR